MFPVLCFTRRRASRLHALPELSDTWVIKKRLQKLSEKSQQPLVKHLLAQLRGRHGVCCPMSRMCRHKQVSVNAFGKEVALEHLP